MSKKRVGIIGATGYTGHELLTILAAHPSVDIEVLNSRSHAGQKVSSIYKDYAGNEVYTGFSYPEINALNLDLIFLALPHGLSMGAVKELDADVRIIDLSADFRFKEAKEYEKIYGKPASYTENTWVYGLPEVFKEDIKKS